MRGAAGRRTWRWKSGAWKTPSSLTADRVISVEIYRSPFGQTMGQSSRSAACRPSIERCRVDQNRFRDVDPAVRDPLEEACPTTRVASHALLIDFQQQGVAVAVKAHL